MQIGKQIKQYRTTMKLSQEELAEKLYVSRQSISNWETEKNYPDIHTLLLMGSLFDVSIDQLLKGDLEIMKNEISLEKINKMKKYSMIYAFLLICMMIAIPALLYFLRMIGAILAALLFAVTLLFAQKLEKLKKENDIQTYKEIVSFLDGQHIDELHKQREYGKRIYQTVFLAIASGCVGFVISYALMYLFHMLD